MEEKKSYRSWTISDEFWEAIKEDIPKKERDPKKKYAHAPGQGRKPMPARKALESIFYVLRTGCQWKALPQEYGSGRGKMGTKRSVLTNEKGLPLAVALSGGNTHDVKLLEETLDHIVTLRPEPDEKHPQNLCLDAGYTGSQEKVQ